MTFMSNISLPALVDHVESSYEKIVLLIKGVFVNKKTLGLCVQTFIFQLPNFGFCTKHFVSVACYQFIFGEKINLFSQNETVLLLFSEKETFILFYRMTLTATKLEGKARQVFAKDACLVLQVNSIKLFNRCQKIGIECFL